MSNPNQVPSFNAGPDDTTNEDSGAQTVTNWATSISEGAGDTGQNLNFIVSNDNTGLFAVQPAVADGDVDVHAGGQRERSATVTVKLHDDGGTANGGVDTSPTQTSRSRDSRQRCADVQCRQRPDPE